MNFGHNLKYPLLYAAAGALLACMICGLLPMLWGFTSYNNMPSNSDLARAYLNAVIEQDAEKAVALALPGCEASVRRDALEDIERYGGARVTVTAILEGRGTGSDEHYRIVEIEFSYQLESAELAQPDEIRIGITYDRRSKRRGIYCGG